MATGTVSSVTGDVWQQISSVTPSGTYVSFSSISGYKKLMVICKDVSRSASGSMTLTFNNDTTAGNYPLGTGSMIISPSLSASNVGVASVIDDVNLAIAHRVSAEVSGYPFRYWYNPVAITSVEVYPGVAGSGATWSSGTIYLYGIAA